jgi:Holliday junction DNA helicase RuvA
MIGRLKGVLLEKQPPHLLIDVQGVGYDVLAPMTSFYHLPDLGAEVVLHTHFAVSETSQQLYGFYGKEERELFRQLVKVSGVGPKMALAILSGMESSAFVRCVMEDNTAALVKVPGVGKKTAERLIIEMRDKLKGWEYAPSADAFATTGTSQAVTSNSAIAEAESALVALGYKPTEASRAVSSVLTEHEVQRSEELIRLALRTMLPG